MCHELIKKLFHKGITMHIKEAMSKVAIRNDGVDHIWVSPFANTQLGKIVSLKWRKKFFIPQLGEFVSPDSFIAWMFTGDESMRQNTAAKLPQLTKEEFKLARQAMFMAKYHQLTALKASLISECQAAEGEKSKLDLPWLEYKQHQSGVKEHHHDTKRVSIVKSMVHHILENGSKVSFQCPDFDYDEVKEAVMAHVKEKFHLEEVQEEQPSDQQQEQ